ncbi:MAG: hypothetical protein SGPRY_010359 [Prymnesium sp.]
MRVLLWVSSRQDLNTLLQCFLCQQQRAVVRAVGFSYMAVTLRMFAQSEMNMSYSLQLLKQAFRGAQLTIPSLHVI